MICPLCGKLRAPLPGGSTTVYTITFMQGSGTTASISSQQHSYCYGIGRHCLTTPENRNHLLSLNENNNGTVQAGGMTLPTLDFEMDWKPKIEGLPSDQFHGLRALLFGLNSTRA